MASLEPLRSLASSQHGLVTREQARRAGFDRRAIRRRVEAGLFTFVTPRVLRIGGSATSPWQSVMAGVLDVGPDAIASHLTAAALWGVPHIDPEPVHVSVERYIRRNTAPVQVHHLTAIPEDQVVSLHDIPVTAPPLTVLLVTGLHGQRRGSQILDHFLASRDTTVPEVWDLTVRMSRQGRNGLCDTRELLENRADHQPPAESNNERRLEYLAREAGITTLRRQSNIHDPAWVGRVDFDDVELPFIVEVHSERYHTSWEHRRADAARIARLEAAGYTVLVIWDWELWYDREGVIDRLLTTRLRLARKLA